MSGDALEAVRRLYTHPKVKGSVRALLDAIAKRIPEGETMTAVIALDDFAADTGYDRRTMQIALDILVATHLVRVVGGGRGRKASYELLALPRAGADPSLPLLGRARPRPPRVPSASPTFFDEPSGDEVETALTPADDTRVSNVGSFFLRTRGNVGSFFLRWRFRAYDVRSFFLRGRGNVGSFFLRLLPLDGTRARATYNNLRTTTTAAAVATDAPKSRPPPCRWLGSSHAWCDGRVHVPMPFHLEERRKLARLPGQTDADLDAELFRLYDTVLAGIPDTAPITDRTEFAFWKRVLRGAPATHSWIPFRRAPPHVRHEGVARGTGSSCPHTPRCEAAAGVTAFVICRDRILAEARAERERKSG